MIPIRKATFLVTRIPPLGGTPAGSASADEVFRFACGLAPGCHAEALPDPSVSCPAHLPTWVLRVPINPRVVQDAPIHPQEPQECRAERPRVQGVPRRVAIVARVARSPHAPPAAFYIWDESHVGASGADARRFRAG